MFKKKNLKIHLTACFFCIDIFFFLKEKYFKLNTSRQENGSSWPARTFNFFFLIPLKKFFNFRMKSIKLPYCVNNFSFSFFLFHLQLTIWMDNKIFMLRFKNRQGNRKTNERAPSPRGRHRAARHCCRLTTR